MIGLRRMSEDREREVLRLARGARLGQAPKDDYSRAMRAAESSLEVS